MKKLGFLSFNHWSDRPGSRVRSAQDALLQAIDLAQGAEEMGIDGAFFRVHHFAQQQSAVFPLLASIAATTSRIQVGTAVLDMRYESPLALAEEAASTDLISGGRLQLGIGRGSPQHSLRGWEEFAPVSGIPEADLVASNTDRFLAAVRGRGVAVPNPERYRPGTALLPVTPRSATLPERIWWGAGSRATAEAAARQGMNLMSSTLMTEDTGVPFEQLQLQQIQRFRAAWAEAGWQHEPTVSVSRTVVPIDRATAATRPSGDGSDGDQLGFVDGIASRFGRSHVDTTDRLVEALGADVAVHAADWLLVTVPNELGVDFDLELLRAVHEIAQAVRHDDTPAV